MDAASRASVESDERRQALASALLAWFSQAMRPLPWRVEYEPYRVWISEIMLQQTQMERGVRYYTEWMRRFPDVQAVADASLDDVLAAWEGLGYYSRARNLHAAAKKIVTEYNGRFPDTLEAIRALPGVGEYTAAAIASIALNIPEPAVDANVLRVFSRLLDMDKPVAGAEARATVTGAARGLMPYGPPRLLNQAFMEFGALICGKTPACEECPVASFCAALRHGTVASRPVKAAKAGYTLIEVVAGIVMKNGRAFIRRRPPGGLWPGLWEFPGGEMAAGERPETALRRYLDRLWPNAVRIGEQIGVVKHGYTTNRVTMHGYFCDAGETVSDGAAGGDNGMWASPAEIKEYSFAAGHRKLLEKIGWK